ncbi:MAG: hypothetical protein HFI06_03790 [Eubacterium sp.]|jgi:hypothetical protein|nr:hypothetical protein [Eubacterium sp.]
MKKIFVTGLAVIALVGISIPVIASSALKGDIRVDGRVQEMDTKNTETDEAAEWDQVDVQQQEAQIKAEPVSDVVPADLACSYYIDANGDGICDHCAGGGADAVSGNGICDQFIDADGNGICDHCVGNSTNAAFGNGSCGYYVDDNGDGICDHCTGTAASAGNGACGYYVDDDGDGVCDHCVGGYGNGNRQQGQGGHHGGGHHGGRHH